MSSSSAESAGTVHVVDDDQASREAVAHLVEEMDVPVRTYGSAEEFLNKYNGERPACLVTDIRMLQMSGLELQEELASQGTTMATIVLTAYADTSITVRAIKNGAVTLLEKPCRDLELWDAIREALAVDRKQYESDLERAELVRRIETLTPQEKEVLALVVAGDPNKAIASKLDVSIRTVEVRRSSIFQKMHADSVAELVRLAMDSGVPL